VLAFVGMAVMPMAVGQVTAYYAYNKGDPAVSSAGLFAGASLIRFGPEVAHFLAVAGVASGGTLAVAAIVAGIIILG